ncbi:hypothetical protein ZWY2020_052157 [Hordeum vulgare]|nr:hypothetical protein ZWY2020_052157 [Hordeum vulgare]
MAQHGLETPGSRSDEDTCISTSPFDINRDWRTWVQTAAIARAVDAPRRLATAIVERLLGERLCLRHGDVAVSSHYLEDFLLKFERKELCTIALDKGRLKMGDGTLAFIKPWRPLAHALRMAIHVRVHLVLDSVPAYVWTHSIVECVIDHTYALDVMDERSISMSDTCNINLWAWTSNPSRKPKEVWLTFTSCAPTVSRSLHGSCLRSTTFHRPPTSVFPPSHQGTVDSHALVSTDDVVIPGELDSRGTMPCGASRGRASGHGTCQEQRP